jgi:hypothetical protein
MFLAGTNDVLNCNMNWFPGCDDNELATYCQAMLQGDNRLDRIIKWKAYMKLLYHRDNFHPLIFAPGVYHDPVQMIFSDVGRCAVFSICT